MRLVYIDEAGSSADHEQEPILTVASIVIHGDMQTLPIEHDAGCLVEQFVPAPLREHFEFHASDLFSGNEKFKGHGWRREERRRLLGEFMKLIPKHNLPVIVGSVDKEGFLNTADISGFSKPERTEQCHRATFVICLTEVEKWFRQYVQYERGLCIADETKSKTILKSSLKWWREGVTFPVGIFRLDHLVDTVYFGNSHESVFLQLADVCAFVVKRTMMERDDVASLFEIIASQVTPMPPKVTFGQARHGTDDLRPK